MSDVQTSRRQLLSGLTIAAALPSVSLGIADTAQAAPKQGAPWGLIDPVKQGDHIALGWTVAGLDDVRNGAVVLTLDHPIHGDARVCLCKKGKKPAGLVQTDHLDIVLMDGGQGDLPTNESLGRVILALAAHIKRGEGTASGSIPGLMTHVARMKKYPGAT